MKFAEMSKINNRVELYFENEIEPVVIKIGDTSLIKDCKFVDNGNIVVTLNNDEVIYIESIYNR